MGWMVVSGMELSSLVVRRGVNWQQVINDVVKQ